MNESIFEQLKKEYETMQSDYQLQINLHREQAVRQCFNKGYLIDILPFEHELHGYKLGKKVLNKMMMETGCFVYHFNTQNKVCLVEGASTFLKRIENYTLYDYHEDYLYKYECQQAGIISVNKYFLNNGRISEGYTYAKFGHSYEQYVYNEERLIKIIVTHFDHQQETKSEWENHFHYDKKEKLELIQQVYNNGYVVNKYADVKLNYKKLETRLYEACKEEIESFLNGHVTEKFNTMALRLWIDDLNPMLDISFSVSEDEKISVADWSYSCVASVSITDIPLDSTQQDKLVSIVYRILVKLLDNGVLHKDIKLKVFYHEEQVIGLDKRAIQKIVAGKQNFF